MINLSIIILNFNTKDYLLSCIQSIAEQNLDPETARTELIVVDNGSNDGSVEATQKKFPWVKTIKNKSNVGYAKANNTAIKISKGEIVLLLNSDTILRPNSLEKILNFIESDKRIGAVSAKLQLQDGSLDLACHRGFPTPWNALTYFLGLERLFPNLKLFSGYHQAWKDFNTPHQVDAISGACFFVKREVIDQVGLLDERYFMYAEDLDWCMRIKKSGWKIYFYPDATVMHFKKKSGREKEDGHQETNEVRKIRAKSIRHFYRTMKLFYDKHYHDKYPRWVRNTVLLGIWIMTRVKLIRNRLL
jgi:GT2 family glycosyltransferase